MLYHFYKKLFSPLVTSLSFFYTEAMWKSILLILVLSLVSVGISPRLGVAAAQAEEEDSTDQPTALPDYTMRALRKLVPSLTRTGVGRDAIPALDRPLFVTVSDAGLSLEDDDVVFVVTFPNNIVRIYPQRILVWHEIVNDVLPDAEGNPGVPGRSSPENPGYTISYSPLTGTVVAFSSMAGSYPTSFGVSGDLLNANSVLYDRISGSLWSQLLATCIEGPFRGKRLERYPVLWAKWRGVKERYLGKAFVLSRSTGFPRPYGRDPYGTYRNKGSYYDDLRLLYAISRLDKRLPPKRRVLGLELGSLYGAVQVEAVQASKVLNFVLGVTPLVAMYDENFQAVRIFDRRFEGKNDQTLTFSVFENKIIDDQTRSTWTPEGESNSGRLNEARLEPVLAIDAMWFAWSSFHRDSDIFPYNSWETDKLRKYNDAITPKSLGIAPPPAGVIMP